MTHLKFISDSGLCRGRPPTLVQSFEFRVLSSEFRVLSSEFRVLSSEFRVLSSELNIRDIGNLKLHGKRPRDWPTPTCSVIPGNGENRDNDRWRETYVSAESSGTGEECPGGSFKV